MLESIVEKIKLKEEESNKKILNAKLKADSILKMVENKRNALIKKYEKGESQEKENIMKKVFNEAKDEIERIKIEEKKKLDLELKKARENERKAIQFVKKYLCD